MTVKSSISLTDEQNAFARALVDRGRFASVSAVIQQALELLRYKTEKDDLEVEALRELLKRRSQGKFISADEMRDRIDAMIESERRDRGL